MDSWNKTDDALPKGDGDTNVLVVYKGTFSYIVDMSDAEWVKKYPHKFVYWMYAPELPDEIKGESK